jgi:hypothetical protein
MIHNNNNIIIKTLKEMLLEQAPPAKAAIETDNAASSADDSPFTPAQEKFLGKFDAYGTQYLGIIYSISDIGIREFIMRSGKDLNLNPGILLSLINDKIVKIVPYSGWGRNDDYTIELQLSLDDVKGLGSEDAKSIEQGSSASGAPAPGGEMAPLAPEGPAPEVAWVVKYGDVLTESAKIAKKLISESTSSNKIEHADKNGIYVKDSRILKTLPTAYVKHLERLIAVLSKKKHTISQKQRLLADILDNLAINFNITNVQIAKSFDMFKKQAKLKKYLKDK